MRLRELFMRAVGFFVNRFMQESSEEIDDFLTSSKEMKAACRQAVAESCVLLKNDGALPLSREKISLFGRVQYNSFYTGYGSGGDVKAPYRVSIAEGIRKSGLAVNERLDSLYRGWTEKNPPYDGFWGFWPFSYPEMPLSDGEIENAAKESDVAIVVIGRAAGEDRENKARGGSFFLTKEEERLLKRVSEKFSKTCVLLNCGSVIDMSWMDRYPIDAVMYVWLGGQELGNGVADVLAGRVSPSGKLPDTIAKLADYPSHSSFGKKRVSEYTEDIYLGYRYFETFAPEKARYPFGFGLTYTRFSIEGDVIAKEDGVEVRGRIRNIGSFPAKAVAELYFGAPQATLGKPKKSLLSWRKTKELKAGESEEVFFFVPKKDLCSFDDTGAVQKNAFVLEKGTYSFFFGEDVRSAREIGSYRQEEDEIVETLHEVCPAKPFLRMVNRDGARLERTPQGERSLKERILSSLPKELSKAAQSSSFEDVLSGKTSVEAFVSSLSDEEIEALLRGSDFGMYDPIGVKGNAGILGGTTDFLRERGLPAVSTNDGMSGIRLQAHCTLIPIATALAATFNEALLEKIGEETGKEMRTRGSDVILAPSVNLHRHPLGGRNFEYFSEDPVLSGKLASAYIRGLQREGASATVKHFACNNQETARHKNDSRVSQRAMRELYLKPFELCVKESDPDFVMMSYNKLNGVYNCYQYDLATTVLREEWNYQGCVMTDWWMDYGKSPDFAGIELQAYRVRAQIDLFMPGSAKFGKYKNKSDGTLLKALKEGRITKGECQRSAVNVVKACIKRVEKRREHETHRL